jgi:uncharacterized protein (AIM24 family)
MATTRVMGRGPKSPVDEEFLQLLQQGGDALAQERLAEARELLERASKLQPRHEKGQNLLGLTYFKLGLFDRAAEIYEGLVRENPVDPTLRINLGLVYLKTNALQRAMREFETATELAPDHKKAHNYLGLALAQAGEYGRAREHFVLAGSDVMAEKMAKAIAGERFAAPKPAASSSPSLQPAPKPGTAAAPTQATAPAGQKGGAVSPKTTQRPGEEDWGSQFGLDEAPPTSAPPSTEAPVAAPVQEDAEAPAAEPIEEDVDLRFAEDEGPSALNTAPPAAPEPPAEASAASEEASPAPEGEELEDDPFAETSAAVEASTPLPTTESQEAQPAEGQEGEEPPAAPRQGLVLRQDEGVPLLSELAPAVALAGASMSSPFRVGHGSFSALVEGELLTRLEGLVAFSGQLSFQPEMRRFRGRPSEQPFGEGAGRLMRATGKGVLFLESGTRAFTALELGEESAYFLESVLFAFEESLSFENGRVPSAVAADLEMVHLRGQGRVLLSLQGGLRSVVVLEGEPVCVPLSHLVGWQGTVSPQVRALLENPGPGLPEAVVELSGEGFALISLPVR